MDKNITMHIYDNFLRLYSLNVESLTALLRTISRYLHIAPLLSQNNNNGLNKILLSLLLYFSIYPQIVHTTAIFYHSPQIRTASF